MPANPQLSLGAKLRRLSRRLGVRRSDDSEGTLATLQIARRLVTEGMLPNEALNEASDKYAAPIDSSRAFWAAHYALSMAGIRAGHTWDFWNEEIDVLLPIFDQAIQSQGSMNLKAKKK